MKTGFAFENLLGGNISEFKLIDNLFNTNIEGVTLPTHLWRGFIVPTKGRVLASQDGRTIALQNTIGQGEALWIPSLLGLGSRIKGDYSALASFLNIELKGSLANVPIRFEKIQSKVLMKTMQSGSSLITMLINKSTEVRNITLSLGNPNLKPTVLYANLGGTVSGKVIKIKPEETIVIEWK